MDMLAFFCSFTFVDIIWLQRDFGLYIVNMFDTGQVALFHLYFFIYCSYSIEKGISRNGFSQLWACIFAEILL